MLIMVKLIQHLYLYTFFSYKRLFRYAWKPESHSQTSSLHHHISYSWSSPLHVDIFTEWYHVTRCSHICFIVYFRMASLQIDSDIGIQKADWKFSVKIIYNHGWMLHFHKQYHVHSRCNICICVVILFLKFC